MKKLVLIMALALVATFSSVNSAEAFSVANFDFSNIFSKYNKTEKIDVSADFDKSASIVDITFSNLKDTKKISYQLTYFSNKQYEGVTGAITVSGENEINKEIFLGTCSTGGNCEPHKNIKWLILRVTTTYDKGKTETRIYPVR